MKKVVFAIMAIALLAVSCTPETLNKNDYQDEVDKDKIERPGNQGGN
tara:strand:- start:2130 stop:2270 length:141 start_codon:yes stop_codon:yes gene_type:complete